MKSKNSVKGIVKTINDHRPCRQVCFVWPVLLMFFPNAGYIHLKGYFRLDLNGLWLSEINNLKSLASIKSTN